jgi:hypothetical protein
VQRWKCISDHVGARAVPTIDDRPACPGSPSDSIETDSGITIFSEFCPDSLMNRSQQHGVTPARDAA